MNKPKYRRRLSNLRYTLTFNVRYLGLWVAIGLFLIILVNVLFYFLIRIYWGGGSSEAADFEFVHTGFIIILAIITLLQAIGIIMLAVTTTHRIAGPWIQVRRVLETIRGGNMDARLHFRHYDGLADVAVAFNEIMDKLNQQRREGAVKE